MHWRQDMFNDQCKITGVRQYYSWRAIATPAAQWYVNRLGDLIFRRRRTPSVGLVGGPVKGCAVHKAEDSGRPLCVRDL